ncbi:hypothetical protein VOA_001844 [Vibrio sp. RC586]|nr:hypothetical protein VOA_001844 [Vibrio sp. RC586]
MLTLKRLLKLIVLLKVDLLSSNRRFCAVNLGLLTECNPDQVDAWYLGIYIDAIEWVDLPYTRGMALFADGGLIATKPYAASGSYIKK